jgi:protein involved in polysaccharide export with SLBB domain
MTTANIANQRTAMIQPIARPLLLALLLLSAPAVLRAQQPRWDSQQIEMSRAELETLLTRYDETSASSAYSGAIRQQARREAELIRGRLANGDFRIGDQIVLQVEGEPQLTSTFGVQSGPSIVLPVIGSISLAGVLRSELEPHLRSEIGRYIRDPSVQARSSVRILMTGGVAQTGYHVVPTNAVFSDLLMMAGGPASNAQLQKIRVERADRVIWEGDALQQAIIEGRTMDQLSIQAGDHIVVPVERPGRGIFTADLHGGSHRRIHRCSLLYLQSPLLTADWCRPYRVPPKLHLATVRPRPAAGGHWIAVTEW